MLRAIGDVARPDRLVWLTVALGLVLRLVPVAHDPLHPDECLYASWALAIRGGDTWLQGQVIDKPPAFPYLLALWSGLVGPGPTALRLVGVVSAGVAMLLIYRIALSAWGAWPAWASVTLVALSPVAVALDATALTDPPAIALGLGAIAAGLGGRPLVAGLLLGLATATKPQLLAYASGVLLALPSLTRRVVGKVGLGLAAVGIAVVLWEWERAPAVGFLEAAVANYGLGSGEVASTEQWAELLRWIWGAAPAIVVWTLTLVAAAVVAIVRGRQRGWDGPGLVGGLVVAGLLYLGAHMVMGAPAWDRYLLALVPLAGLGFAGAIARVATLVPDGARPWFACLTGVALAISLWSPALDASQSRLPLGDTSRWQGFEGMADYVRGQVPGRATILHRDLGWHIAYYMAGYPQDFRWYLDGEQLVEECSRATPVYILIAADQDGLRDLDHLETHGFSLRLRHATYRHDGSPALLLYLVRTASDAT